jgi:DNA-binding CsgD family transcriptional regulator
MSEGRFPITITAQMRHGVLWEARQKLGSTKALGAALGIGQARAACLINFSWAPGERWLQIHGSQIELKLSEVLGRPITLEEVFPPELCTEAFQQRRKRVEYTFEVAPERLLEAGAIPALQPAPDAYDLKEAVARAAEDLKPRERDILMLRYGLNEERHSLTREEIASAYGVSKERIAQVERKALRKLRHPSRSRLLRPFVERRSGPRTVTAEQARQLDETRKSERCSR